MEIFKWFFHFSHSDLSKILHLIGEGIHILTKKPFLKYFFQILPIFTNRRFNARFKRNKFLQISVKDGSMATWPRNRTYILPFYDLQDLSVANHAENILNSFFGNNNTRSLENPNESFWGRNKENWRKNCT